ncbi:MAG: hypothetical protein ACEY3J_00330 [Arsenophonus sp.]
MAKKRINSTPLSLDNGIFSLKERSLSNINTLATKSHKKLSAKNINKIVKIVVDENRLTKQLQ